MYIEHAQYTSSIFLSVYFRWLLLIFRIFFKDCSRRFLFQDCPFETVQLKGKPRSTWGLYGPYITSRLEVFEIISIILSVQDLFWVNFFQNFETVHEWTIQEKWTPQTRLIIVEFMNFWSYMKLESEYRKWSSWK